MAGAGVPVSMDDGTGIAAAPAIVCPLPGVARSGEKWPKVFLGVLPRPELSKLGGVRNLCGVIQPHFFATEESPTSEQKLSR